jgi:hypothetical protein
LQQWKHWLKRCTSDFGVMNATIRTILGKRGDIHRGTSDGVSGYYVSIMYLSARKFRTERAKCSLLGQITQEGDTEAVVFISRSSALANAHILSGTIHARQIKGMSLEAQAAGAERLRIYREAALATEAVGHDETSYKGKTHPATLTEKSSL